MPAVQVPTVALRHRVGDDSHVDWMVEKLGCGGAEALDMDARTLATWRMAVEPGEWEAGRSYEAERIGDHRRVYLVYQGPLSDGRGEVERIDAGVATVVRWEDAAIVMEVDMERFVGRVEVVEQKARPVPRASPEIRWEVRVLERRGGGGMMR